MSFWAKTPFWAQAFVSYTGLVQKKGFRFYAKRRGFLSICPLYFAQEKGKSWLRAYMLPCIRFNLFGNIMKIRSICSVFVWTLLKDFCIASKLLGNDVVFFISLSLRRQAVRPLPYAKARERVHAPFRGAFAEGRRLYHRRAYAPPHQ